MMNKINSVCVYCASSTKIDSVYFDAARELGTLLGQRQIRLINGAGNMGPLCPMRHSGQGER